MENNKRCLILGGNGFIGSNLIKYLGEKSDYSLTSFDREYPVNKINNVKYIKGEFSNDKELLDAVREQDIIIHLISTTNPGKSMIDPYSGYTVDVSQIIKILEAIKGTNSKIIFASSGGTVYGEPNECPIKEDHELNPICHYGIIKVTIEKIINMYNSIYGMNNKIMRISNPYGPGQDYTKGVGLIDAVIKKALNNETVTIWGDGNNIRDYIYIDDLCEAVKLICEYSGSETIFNIGSGEGNSINEIVSIVKKILNKDIKIEYTKARENDIKHVYLDITKLTKTTNFKIENNIYNGIKKYIGNLI